MSKIIIEEKHITEYIKDTLSDCRSGSIIVNNAKYHHNTSYREAPNICRHGILSLVEQQKQGIKDYTSDFLTIMNDIESHVNGNDSISLSVVGLKDLYPGEDEYNPYSPSMVDFLITSDIIASRSTHHYGNEFLVHGSISTDKLKAIDIRLLRLIQLIEKNRNNPMYNNEKLVSMYNNLREIALTMRAAQLDIPLREMSQQDDSNLDIDKISTAPILVLK